MRRRCFDKSLICQLSRAGSYRFVGMDGGMMIVLHAGVPGVATVCGECNGDCVLPSFTYMRGVRIIYRCCEFVTGYKQRMAGAKNIARGNRLRVEPCEDFEEI